MIPKDNVIVFKGTFKRRYKKHKKSNFFPKGTLECKSVLVNLAQGMYQFHDLMSSITYLDETPETVLNDNSLKIGFINF